MRQVPVILVDSEEYPFSFSKPTSDIALVYVIHPTDNCVDACTALCAEHYKNEGYNSRLVAFIDGNKLEMHHDKGVFKHISSLLRPKGGPGGEHQHIMATAARESVIKYLTL